MTIEEAMIQAVRNYINQNGTGNVVTRQELAEMVSVFVPVGSDKIRPADSCYNRTNKGIKYENRVHLFEITERGKYKVLGENYAYSGPVFERKEDGKGYEVKGVWNDGRYEKENSDIYPRLVDLYNSLMQIIKKEKVRMEGTSVVIASNDADVFRVLIMDEAYKMSTSESSWKEETSYLCMDENGAVVYYVDTIDECFGEIKRFMDFVSVKDGSEHTSTLSKVVTAESFE